MYLLQNLQGCICFQHLSKHVCSFFSDKVVPQTGRAIIKAHWMCAQPKLGLRILYIA